MSEATDTISGDVMRVLRRRWLVVAQLLVAGAAVGALLAFAQPSRQQATATVLIESALAAGGSEDSSRLTAEAAARLVTTRGVAQRVRRRLGADQSVGELLDAVSAQPDASGAFVDVTAEDAGAAEAARIANAFAGEFIEERDEAARERLAQATQALQRQLEGAAGARERSQLRSQLAELRAAAALQAIDAQIVDPAVAGLAEEDADPLEWGLIGAALGLLLGLVAAFALEALDPRLRSLRELRGLVRAPQLAAMRALPVRGRRDGRPPALVARPEPFEHLRGALAVFADERLGRLLVTSAADRREQKTPVAANLAVALARADRRVCVVDADLREPALAAQFGLDDDGHGLADVLDGAPLDGARRRFVVPSTESDDGSVGGHAVEVTVVPAGRRRGNATLTADGRLQDALEQLGRDHDVVILDCPPVTAAGDALALVERASATILVVRHSHSRRTAVSRAAQVVDDSGGSLVGVVATGVPKGELKTAGFGPWPVAVASRHES